MNGGKNDRLTNETIKEKLEEAVKSETPDMLDGLLSEIEQTEQKKKDIQLVAKGFLHILCSFPVKRGRGFSWDETHDEASPLFYRLCLFKQLPFSCRIRQPDR